ncbi:2-amino-4-hydroxy-6-hydroxymethyldihydropteridine diphosphokinase [Virgibacillus sp. W0430]|uniref:2-amino-4-hydroxy-6- hydroxymethyldihydropteridine diphosphokinase n=1 Tax=Virgibacillus sp. W0430 TaxID=3391580 RepID=UPI003F478427
MNEAFIALGTNIEPRASYIDEAINALLNNRTIQLERKSSIYETAPVGYLDQADFLNMVIKVTTDLSPNELLDQCQAIEQRLGRKRTIRNGPRTIDLDILLYNQEKTQAEHLVIPHPRMHERAFVLVPLNEIAADAIVPGFNIEVKALLEKNPQEEIDGIVLWEKKSSTK